MLKLTVIANSVNVRSGPGDGASIIDKSIIGNQFDVINMVDVGSREKWARIRHPKHQQAYICVRTAAGSVLAKVENFPDAASGDYIRGWNACCEAFGQVVETMKK